MKETLYFSMAMITAYGKVLIYIALFILLTIYLIEKIKFYKKLNNDDVIDKIIAHHCKETPQAKSETQQDDVQEDENE